MDALPASGGAEGGKSAPPNMPFNYTGKRIALYIGNLTWVSPRLLFSQLGYLVFFLCGTWHYKHFDIL